MYIRVAIHNTSGDSAGLFEGHLIGSLTGLGQNPPLPNLNAWTPLISFRPPTAIQRNIKSRGVRLGKWDFHRIEKGVGPVNLDYYPVEVSRLPVLGGVASRPEQFLEHIRLNINSFVDPRLTQFAPYDQNEARIWTSTKPLGAVLHLDFRVFVDVATKRRIRGRVLSLAAEATSRVGVERIAPDGPDRDTPSSSGNRGGARSSLVRPQFHLTTRGLHPDVTWTIAHGFGTELWTLKRGASNDKRFG